MPIYITIATYPFEVSTPYQEGHKLTAAEAFALNSTRAENLRNTFRPKVISAVEEGTPDLKELQALLSDLDSKYEFKVRSLRNSGLSPVALETYKIAKGIILAKLQAKKIEPKTLGEGQLDELIEDFVVKNPQVSEEAALRVKERQAIADSIFATLNLG